MESRVRGADETELLRASAYTLIARLMARAPDREFLAGLSQVSSSRIGGGSRSGEDATPFGAALSELAAEAAATTPRQAEREFHDLFIGVTRGEIVPYASFYISGFLFDRPLARLRADMARLGIARAAGVAEPEDHVASLFETMAVLIAGTPDGAAPDPEGERMLFERHVAPWAADLFADLERAPSARLYRPVGRLGRAFMDIEREAFALTPA